MTQQPKNPDTGRNDTEARQAQGRTRSGDTAGDRDVTGNPAEGYQNSLAATKDMMEGDDAKGIARGD